METCYLGWVFHRGTVLPQFQSANSWLDALQWRMVTPVPLIEDDEAESEARALAAAVAVAEADPRRVPHEEVRIWLLRLANGEFDAPPPTPR